MSDRIEVGIGQVEELIRAQFPQWSHLPVRPVVLSGWSNRSFRLGDTMLVRLPSAERYVAQVEKEHTWLPRLASHLRLPIPKPLALGAPGEGYPFPWSVYGWLEGEPLAHHLDGDMSVMARDVAQFLQSLQAIDASDGPAAGVHNFYRGGALSFYDGETRNCAIDLQHEIDAELAMEIWDRALSSSWSSKPVWVHGDVSDGNLLVKDGRLCAAIDFGSVCVGDPACDLVMAWNVFDVTSRSVFRSALPFDAETWQRARGWALWKAMLVLSTHRAADNALAAWARRAIAEVLADYGQELHAR